MHHVELVLKLLAVLLAGAVFAASVCRLRTLQKQTHQLVWVEAYFCMGFGAACAAFDAIERGASFVICLLLAGAALWLWGSRLSWRNGAPPYLERPAR